MANYTNNSLVGAQNTLSKSIISSLSHSQSLNAGYAVSLDDFGTVTGSHVKKYQVFEIEEDLLALSAAWKRLRDEHTKGGTYHGISKLLDKDLFPHVTEGDREMASTIRDYYSKKIMLWKLKGQNLSRFREDLNSFVHSNGKMFKEDMLPLAYRLPEFHAYDVGFDELASEHNKIVKDRDSSPIKTKQLTLCKTFIIGKRSQKAREYWFTDQEDNLVSLRIQKDNPLSSLMDVYTKKPFEMLGRYNVRERDNVQFMDVEKYTFL